MVTNGTVEKVIEPNKFILKELQNKVFTIGRGQTLPKEGSNVTFNQKEFSFPGSSQTTVYAYFDSTDKKPFVRGGGGFRGKSPEEQKAIARAVSVNNVFGNVDVSKLISRDIDRLLEMAEQIEKWLLR